MVAVGLWCPPFYPFPCFKFVAIVLRSHFWTHFAFEHCCVAPTCTQVSHQRRSARTGGCLVSTVCFVYSVFCVSCMFCMLSFVLASLCFQCLAMPLCTPRFSLCSLPPLAQMALPLFPSAYHLGGPTCVSPQQDHDSNKAIWRQP